MTLSRIDILLATYNGSNYLREQLDSILHQSYRNWRVIIRDDGSTDATRSICEEFTTKYPERFKILQEQQVGRLGAAGSFSRLMENSDAPIIAFCDQDDIWVPEKLELQLLYMNKLMASHGSCPILIHSDLEVIDENGRQLADSFWDYQNLVPIRMQTLERLLIQNCVTGCTCVANRELIDIVLPVPDEAIMHDWWLALLAQASGVLACMNQVTVKYRQHETNDTGAKRWDIAYIIRNILHGRTLKQEGLAKTLAQARALLLSGYLDSASHDIVQHYVDLYDKGWLRRRAEIIRGGYYKYGILRNLGVMLSI